MHSGTSSVTQATPEGKASGVVESGPTWRGHNGPVNTPVRPTGTRDYGLAPALRARLLGTSLAVLGMAVLLGAGVVAVADLPVGVLTGLVVLAVVAVVALGLLLGPRRFVVRLDDVLLVKRVSRNSGCFRVASDNPAWPSVETDTLDVIGRVVWLSRAFA